MASKRILTIQDVSCVGQCSITVALPVLSALGHETCVLPTAVLSTHTGGQFKDFTFRDLSSDISAICQHWKKMSINFDAIYTGYLGNHEQIDFVNSIIKNFLKDEGKVVIDPVMGDNGELYSGFDSVYVEKMKGLIKEAQVILPNLTEACLLTGIEFQETGYDEAYVKEVLEALSVLGPRNVVITGISFKEDETGAAILEEGDYYYFSHKRYDRMFHGTGDLFASTFAGYWLSGLSLKESASKTIDFITACIENTVKDKEHWYGVHFEEVLWKLTDRCRLDRNSNIK